MVNDDLIYNPLEHVKARRVEWRSPQGTHMILVDDDSGKPIRDHAGRFVMRETSDGLLMVVDRDGYEMVTGMTVHRDGRKLNRYTGEAFGPSGRVLLPVKGPRVGESLLMGAG